MKVIKFILLLCTLLAKDISSSGLVTALPHPTSASPVSLGLLYGRADTDVTEGKIGGEWKIVGNSGVEAMHIAVVSHNEIVIIDKVEANPIKQANGNPAISTLYNIETNEYRILNLDSDTFCTAGSWFSNGTLLHAGGAENQFGYNEGYQSIRFFTPGDGADWSEIPGGMTSRRWYPAMATLPSGDVLVFGGAYKGTGKNNAGINNPTYEIWPAAGGVPEKAFDMPFLTETLPYNLYAFLHVMPNNEGKQIAFVFVNKQGILYDFDTATILKRLPEMPGGHRSYPLTGNSVLLPLNPPYYKPIVMICGGNTEMEIETLSEASCGRIDPTEDNPQWEMDDFGGVGRVMPDSVIMPTGKILYLNGAGAGFAGYHRGPNTNPLYVAIKPVLAPSVYDPETKEWSRFAPSTIPRMYHSVATLVSDGRIFVAGSNPQGDVYTESEFPTEYRVEMFSPPYLLTGLVRPKITSVGEYTELNTQRIPVSYGLNVEVTVISGQDVPNFKAVVIHHGFVTHSNHFSQRFVSCNIMSAKYLKKRDTSILLTVEMPPYSSILPPGPSYLYILDNEVPADAAVELLLN
ncbi:12815_t:CDS:2 [Funneliformis mosseae]|uniref:12815_t:CDS:1 n=1 Tax=Funneliformis mosseae TaxID=27381 RepID=A0A9N8Z5Q8_FUNMO|nr:12815_t:CDS:2 [Funneliformis mosseae]